MGQPNRRLRAAVNRAVNAQSSNGRTIDLAEVKRILAATGSANLKLSGDDLEYLFKVLDSPVLGERARKHLKQKLRQRSAWELSDGNVKKVISVLRKFGKGTVFSTPKRFGGTLYTARDFFYVADRIQDGAMKVLGYDATEGGTSSKVMKNSNGLYTSNRNVLMIRTDRNTSDRQSTIVHEAVHAIQDMKDLRLRRLSIEAAAHIAQMMFLVRARQTVSEKSKLFSAIPAAKQAMTNNVITDGNYQKVRERLKKIQSYARNDRVGFRKYDSLLDTISELQHRYGPGAQVGKSSR